MTNAALYLRKKEHLGEQQIDEIQVEQSYTVTIASSGSLSDAAYIGAETVVAILMPAAWTAAALSFEVSQDGSTYYDLQYEGSEVTFAAGVDEAVVLDPAKTYPFSYIKVRSGTEATPVNQAADRDLILLTKNI